MKKVKAINSRIPFSLTFILLSLSFVLAFTGCKKESMEPEEGSLTVNMTDSPANYAALNVEITRVEIYHDGAGWIELNNQTQTHNIITLTNGKQVSLSSNTGLAAGFYSRLRLSFGPGSELDLSSGNSVLSFSLQSEQSVEIPVNFQLEAGANASLLIDFHAAESVVEIAGQYFLRPVITYVRNVNTGVRGSFSNTARAAVKVGNSSQSYHTYTNVNGEFLLRGLEPGTYSCELEWRDELGRIKKHVVNGVVVAEGEITAVGRISI